MFQERLVKHINLTERCIYIFHFETYKPSERLVKHINLTESSICLYVSSERLVKHINLVFISFIRTYKPYRKQYLHVSSERSVKHINLTESSIHVSSERFETYKPYRKQYMFICFIRTVSETYKPYRKVYLYLSSEWLAKHINLTESSIYMFHQNGR